MEAVSLSFPVSVNKTFDVGPSTQLADNKVPDNNGVSFSQVLSDVAQDFSQSIKTAEATSIAGIKGDVGVYEVATSVMEAEQQLRMAAAIRDRTVQAFQELSRMQI